MTTDSPLEKTPWDARALRMDTYELSDLSEKALCLLKEVRGHVTAKIDPLTSPASLLRVGFYYCDTLVEPFCSREQFRPFVDGCVEILSPVAYEQVLPFVGGTFQHGRFHRDPNIPPDAADRRYAFWLADLCAAGTCFGLRYQGVLCGFLGYTGSRLVLHALGKEFRGKGLAKYLWTAACRDLFGRGQEELQSSISAANLPALNLYASLGFRFRKARDVYHYYRP